ncbi:hypothetical protein GGF32_005419 [Allomyces javanicus]|nr:hypothetical protein GGF32_005419 [Allomyces javanicus]
MADRADVPEVPAASTDPSSTRVGFAADIPSLKSTPLPTTTLPPGEDVTTENAADPELSTQGVTIPLNGDSHDDDSAAVNRSSLPANSELSPILERDELAPSPPIGDGHANRTNPVLGAARLDGPTPTPSQSATVAAVQDAETRLQASFSAPQLRSLLDHAATRARTANEIKASTTRRSRARSPSPGPGRRPRSRKSSVRSVDRDTAPLSPAELVEVDRKLAMLGPSSKSRAPTSSRSPSVADLGSQSQAQAQHEPKAIISTHEYMHAVLYGADMPQGADQKSERLSNFFQVPVEVEKTLWLGYVICLDSFLGLFTILPLRVALAARSALASLISSKWRVHPNHIMDVYRFVILVSAVAILLQIDPSHTYHFIRGQSMIKLYVIFNLLEVCDRLCCSFGMDILDSLFARVNPASMGSLAKPNRLPLILHAVIAVGYVVLHAVVFLYQMITLNVTINSHNNALVSLIISNQFIEVKSTVFKRFEVEPLFQITCSDMVERMNLGVFLTLNVVRNYLELANNTDVTGSWVVSVPVLWWTGGGAWLWQSAANLATAASDWLDATDFGRLARHVLDYLTASTWGEITLPLTDQLWPATQAVSDWVGTAPTTVEWHWQTWSWMAPAWVGLVWTVTQPALLMASSEVAVDWIKVAEVYHRYRYVLCLELSDSITVASSPTPTDPAPDSHTAASGDAVPAATAAIPSTMITSPSQELLRSSPAPSRDTPTPMPFTRGADSPTPAPTPVPWRSPHDRPSSSQTPLDRPQPEPAAVIVPRTESPDRHEPASSPPITGGDAAPGNVPVLETVAPPIDGDRSTAKPKLDATVPRRRSSSPSFAPSVRRRSRSRSSAPTPTPARRRTSKSPAARAHTDSDDHDARSSADDARPQSTCPPTSTATAPVLIIQQDLVPLVSRRIGFAALALAALTCRMVADIVAAADAVWDLPPLFAFTVPAWHWEYQDPLIAAAVVIVEQWTVPVVVVAVVYVVLLSFKIVVGMTLLDQCLAQVASRPSDVGAEPEAAKSPKATAPGKGQAPAGAGAVSLNERLARLDRYELIRGRIP